MFSVEFRQTGRIPKQAKRVVNRALRTGFAEIAAVWHRDMRPKHFTHAGAREYQYTPRQGERGSGRRFAGSYTQRKLRVKGHTLPLVWSGQSRRLASLRSITATSKGSKVRIQAPTLNRPRKGGRKSMRQEMTTVSQAEAATLQRLLQRSVNRSLKRAGRSG